MGELILLTGGVRSGKSGMAERLAAGVSDRVLYIATAEAGDGEMRERIRRHREARPKTWETLEAYRDLGTAIAGAKADCVIVDCITMLMTRLLMDCPINWDEPDPPALETAETEITCEIRRMLDGIRAFPGRVILVTNEIGWGLVPVYPMGRFFRDMAGRVNQLLAKESDTVLLMVSGIPMTVKGEIR